MSPVLNFIRARIVREPTLVADVISGLVSAGWGVMMIVHPAMFALPSYEQLVRNLEACALDYPQFGIMMLVFGLALTASIFFVRHPIHRLVHRLLQLGGTVVWWFLSIMFWTVQGVPIGTGVVVYTVLAFASVWAFLEFGRR